MVHSFALFCQQHSRFRRLTDYLGTHLDEALNLAELAEVACLSPSQLMRLYCARTGEGPMQTVRRLRLQRAQAQLLSLPERPITQIAFDAGYDSQAAFTHAYRRQFGLAPSHARRQCVDRSPTPWQLHLTELPAQPFWQFRYQGRYQDNGHFKARLAWLCLAAGGRRWRGWRFNDCDHPFDDEDAQHVDLCHGVPYQEQPWSIAEADLLSHPGGRYAVIALNPAERQRCIAELAPLLRERWRCVIREGRIMERDLHLRDFRPPQDRRIALYVPVAPLRSPKRRYV